MVTIGIQIRDDFQQLAVYHGSTIAIGTQMTGITVEQLLFDLPEIDHAEFGMDELEEATRLIEGLPHARWWQPLAVARDIDVEPRIKKLAERLSDAQIPDGAKMHSDVAAPGVLPEHGWRKIPARIAVARQAVTIEAWLTYKSLSKATF